ncbi:FUSC family protein [Microbacterium sp. zg-Y818]|uniref:FUSC family protein n=1 Tax=unclassified Microbacterium TaxID=2609290 RepID=UPI00214C8515|nr:MULTISPECIES: FUSC family protein [unclassified Microbacterium]MCR2801368.1 FUSC family protein [Microbacterium sp. zg.Y818]WIM21194.1 FUSC family protein [Microbacterium sp. zg-Y818]
MNAPADPQGVPVGGSGDAQVRERRRRPQRTRRPKGTPTLLVLMIIVVLPSVLLADAWGAGAAGIIGGLTGMFSLVAFMGGPLRADLRIAVSMGPLLIIAAAVPRLVAETSRPAAMALVVLLTVVAALLPLIGPRFGTAGMGLGMTTMFGYGYAPQGGADHQQVIAAAVAGVVVALLLRIVMGISDPSKPTREQVAAVLTADDPSAATATAFGTWLSDGRQRWLADALEGASRYRLALRTARVGRAGGSADATALQERARELAEKLKAKPRRDTGGQSEPATATATTPPASAVIDVPLTEAARALDTVEQAIREHDTSAVQLERDRRHQLKDAVLHPSARLQSIQLRHALRAGLAVLLMLLITSGLEPGDPLVSTALLTTFSILQASWGDTATKTRNKIIGVVAGSLTVAVILLLVPHTYLVAIAAVSLCLGLWYIVTRPALGGAFMVVVSVGFNAVSRDLDPVTLLLQYVGLTASAVLVGVILGFVVIPGLRPAPLRRRIENATAATANALRASSNGGGASGPDEIALFRDAARAQDELVPDRDRLDDRQLAELDDLQTGLRDLTTLAAATTLTREELEQVLGILSRADGTEPDEQDGTAAEGAGTASSTLWDLAQQAASAERYLLRTLPVTR